MGRFGVWSGLLFGVHCWYEFEIIQILSCWKSFEWGHLSTRNGRLTDFYQPSGTFWDHCGRDLHFQSRDQGLAGHQKIHVVWRHNWAPIPRQIWPWFKNWSWTRFKSWCLSSFCDLHKSLRWSPKSILIICERHPLRRTRIFPGDCEPLEKSPPSFCDDLKWKRIFHFISFRKWWIARVIYDWWWSENQLEGWGCVWKFDQVVETS